MKCARCGRPTCSASSPFTRRCCRSLRESSDARIVNVSSGVGSLTQQRGPGLSLTSAIFGPVYPASKAALNAMTLAMMIELESTGIKVNLVSPGLHQDEP